MTLFFVLLGMVESFFKGRTLVSFSCLKQNITVFPLQTSSLWPVVYHFLKKFRKFRSDWNTWPVGLKFAVPFWQAGFSSVNSLMRGTGERTSFHSRRGSLSDRFLQPSACTPIDLMISGYLWLQKLTPCSTSLSLWFRGERGKEIYKSLSSQLALFALLFFQHFRS